MKITKGSYAYNGYVSNYNVEILNSFNPELQLTDTKSTIRNELNSLLTDLKVFIFLETLVSEFKNLIVMINQNITLFIRPQRLKQLLMRVKLMMHLNQSITQLYQIYKNLLEQVRLGLFIQLWTTPFIFQAQALK